MVWGTPWNADCNQTNDALKDSTSWSKTTKIAGIVGLTGAVTVGWPLALGAAGWGAEGVSAGSLAAGMQGSNVVAGSAFAFAQSAGAGGAAAGILNGITWGAGGMVAVREAFRGSNAEDNANEGGKVHGNGEEKEG